MRVRRAVAVICFVALAATDSTAFKLDVHAEITEETLIRFTEGLQTTPITQSARNPVYWREMLGRGFVNEAVWEITDANKVKDTGDCGDANDPDVPAEVCTFLLSEGLAAFKFLSEQPPPDHFDAEEIQEGSNRVFRALETIRLHLLARRFVAARKVLGATLHAIQDFYAHTNWVELNLRPYEARLGKELNAFREGTGKPRIAEKGEPTCRGGDRLLTDLTRIEREAFSVEFAKMRLGSEQILQRVFADPPLTSGYFSFADDGLPDVADGFKCRHGYYFKPGVDGTGVQPGIAKDSQTKSIDVAYDTARSRAVGHSVAFVERIFADTRLGLEHVLGLMGYESRITHFNISQVPGPPPGQTMWDGVVEVLFAFWLVHPDIETCVTAGRVGQAGRGRICAAICEDADTENLNRQCNRPIGPRGLWLPADGDIGVEVFDIDPAGRQLMAAGNIPVSHECLRSDPRTPRPPCEIEVKDRGILRIYFDIPGTCVQLLDKECVSVHKEPSAQPEPSTPPPAAPPAPPAPPPQTQTLPAGPPPEVPPPPPTLTPVPAPSTTPPVLPPVLGPLPLLPEIPDPEPSTPIRIPAAPPLPPSPPATPGATPPSLPPLVPPAPSAPGPAPAPAPVSPAPGAGGGTAPPPTRPSTAEEIDAQLGLRDQDNCVGGDMFFPQGVAFAQSPLGRQLGPEQANRVYQTAAFAMTISDPAARQAVLNAIQSRAGDDTFYGVMTQVIGDIQQSRTIVSAYQDAANYVAGRIVSTGLFRLLQPARPPTAIASDVNGWILRRLATAPLASEAVDRIFSSNPTVSAECTVNQLAKDGFTDAVNAR